MIQHAIPYAQPSRACRCPVQDCGGIIPDPDCVDHGAKKEPAMGWHPAGGERCTRLVSTRPRYVCAEGHPLLGTFRLPATDPDCWDDSCESNCRP